MSIEMTGWVSAKKEVRTLKDLRDLVAWADKYKVSDEAIVERNFTHLFIDFLGVPESAKATWIECGDHLWGDEHWDVLIETHKHPEYENGDDDEESIICAVCGISYEHEDFGVAATAKFNEGTGDYDLLCEVCTAEEPAQYDWPAKDRLNRYGDEMRPE